MFASSSKAYCSAQTGMHVKKVRWAKWLGRHYPGINFHIHCLNHSYNWIILHLIFFIFWRALHQMQFHCFFFLHLPPIFISTFISMLRVSWRTFQGQTLLFCLFCVFFKQILLTMISKPELGRGKQYSYLVALYRTKANLTMSFLLIPATSRQGGVRLVPIQPMVMFYWVLLFLSYKRYCVIGTGEKFSLSLW